MSVSVNVRKSKIMRTPVKIDVLTYAMYAKCRTLGCFKNFTKLTETYLRKSLF